MRSGDDVAREEGRVVYSEAYGEADLAAGTPMGLQTLFRLYSQTCLELTMAQVRPFHFFEDLRKPFLVVGFFILQERGLVDLEDEVKRYLPEFADAVVGAKRTPLVRPMLVRHLLSHTSGIGFGPGFGYEPENAYEVCYVPLVKKVDRGEITSLAEWCRELAKVPLRRSNELKRT